MSVTKFCAQCDRLLRPRSDKTNGTLVWVCDGCAYQEESDSKITYSKEIRPQSENRVVSQDPTLDPWLPRTRNGRCPHCNHKEAAFFKAKAGSEVGFSLFFVCCKCSQRWQERPSQEQCSFFGQ